MLEFTALLTVASALPGGAISAAWGRITDKATTFFSGPKAVGPVTTFSPLTEGLANFGKTVVPAPKPAQAVVALSPMQRVKNWGSSVVQNFKGGLSVEAVRDGSTLADRSSPLTKGLANLGKGANPIGKVAQPQPHPITPLGVVGQKSGPPATPNPQRTVKTPTLEQQSSPLASGPFGLEGGKSPKPIGEITPLEAPVITPLGVAQKSTPASAAGPKDLGATANLPLSELSSPLQKNLGGLSKPVAVESGQHPLPALPQQGGQAPGGFGSFTFPQPHRAVNPFDELD